MTSAPRFVLHVSVALRWWHSHLPHALPADRFLHERLAAAGVRLLALRDFALDVMAEVVRDSGEYLVGPVSETLAVDIPILFAMLTERGFLEYADRRPLARRAFVTAGLYVIPFADALTVTLAEDRRLPLLIADEELYQRLSPIERERPEFRQTWLPDYMGS